MNTQLLVLAHDQRAGERALALGQLDRLDALRAAALDRVVGDRGALAEAVLGHDEQLGVVARDVHREHRVALLGHVHAAHAGRVAAHRPHPRLVEARRVARARDHDDVVLAARAAHVDQLSRRRAA